MKSLSACLLGLMVLAGCSSTNVKPQADTTPKSTESQQANTNNATGSNQQAAPDNTAPAAHSIYFSFDQSDVKNNYEPVLQANANWLKKHADTKVVLQGNTDERGSSEYNLALGNRRAENTKKALSMLGVASKNIEVVSFGKEKPKAACHEESCWAENRRADIVNNSVN